MKKFVFAILGGALSLVAGVAPLVANALPADLQKERIFSVAQQVSTVKFSPNDDRIFVGEKNGIIRVYKNKFDTNPTQVVNLSGEIYQEVDHGLLGLEVHPNFPATPVIFALYSRAYGANAARLKRITIDPVTNVAVSQQILYEGFCNQSTSHSVGDLNFHTDLTNPNAPVHTLYMTVGDMASPGKVDLGQTDNCGNAAHNVGALRSQLFRTANNTNYNGTLTRLTEAEFMGNTPLTQLKIAAYGLRNPFRFAVQPNTGEIYIADVGWNNVEEINYVPAPRDDTVVENFGWPCYEGTAVQGGYQGANAPLCTSLYAANTAAKPFWEYNHNGGQAAATGAAVYTGNLYPAQYKNGLFIADYSQSWIRFLPATDNGKPNKNTSFAAAAFDTGAPVIQLETGPLGDVYYLSYNLNTNKFELWRIKSVADPKTIATATADAAFVLPGNTVSIDATTSFVASGTARYDWDLNADGVIDVTNGAGVQNVSFATAGEYVVTVRVSDSANLTNTDTASVPVIVTESIPKPAITRPESTLTWATGDIIDLDGGVESGSAPAASFSWNVLISHCAKNDPTDCHLHDDISRNVPVSTFVAPDHEYPSHLNAKLCATGFSRVVDGWWNDGWLTRRQVSVDTSDLGNQTNFKVLVNLTAADIDYATAGANGKSLRFVSKTGTVYSHKINTWNTNGTSTVWLQYPTTAGGKISNAVWMYYGNTNAADGQDLGVTFPAATQNADRVSISAAQARQQTLKACKTVPLQPRLANIIMASNPTGLQTTFGSTTAAWTQPIPSIIGSTATISAPLSQVKDVNKYDFLNWSHGGGRLQEFITPNVAEVTLTANYQNMGVVFNPCTYPTMGIRGSFNAWASTAMQMVAQCTWGVTVDVVTAANATAKFDVANNWATNFGDNNNDGVAEQGGGNITIPGGAGRYYITFNDQSKAYTITKVVASSSAAAVSSSSAVSSVVAASSVASSVAASSAPASIYHVRGTHNAWLEGDLMTPVVGSATDFEICRNFAAGDANGGPRFKIDPNGAWGADAFPAADQAAAGWTRIVINGTTRVITSKTMNLPVNCGVVASSSAAASSSSVVVASSSVASSSVESSLASSSVAISSSVVASSSAVASSSEAASSSAVISSSEAASSSAVASSSAEASSSSAVASSVAQSSSSVAVSSSAVAVSSSSSSVPTTVNVQFTCNKGTTVTGQNVYVVGSVAQLGNWVTTAAVKLNPTAYPSWTGTIALPPSTAITWKCIKIQGAAVVWQGGANNALTTPATGAANAVATF